MKKDSWNLNDLFENQNKLDKSVSDLLKKSETFFSKYNGKLKNIDKNDFLRSIKEYENILEGIGRVLTYAFLNFSVDAKLGGYLAKYEEIYTKINEKLLFFELEFNLLSKEKQDEFITFSKGYEYYLKSIKQQKKYQLSKKEERIMLKKSVLGASAFSRLFDEHFSSLVFSFNGKKISEEEILSHLYDKDRKVRKNAAKGLSKGLKEHQHLLGFIFNMIKKDLKIKCELRGYETPETPRHQDNKISQKSVDMLVLSAQKEYKMVQEYYETKKRVLGYKRLYDYDRYAPIGDFDGEYKFAKAKKQVLKSFMDFSPKFHEVAQKAFDEKWIDIYPKKDKRGGAFSHPAVPSVHPYVLLNYTNKRRDLFTLAHELGHAIHQYLAREVGYLNSDTPLTTAETASVFAEMLAYDSLKKELKKEDRLALVGGKLEDIFATLFRQINFTTFERRVHEKDEELTLEEFNRFWLEENKKMFADSIVFTDGYEMWWSYIPHFIHSPFYCYAYGYGQLLVLALYGLYKSKKCKNFVEIYTKFLSLGGSKSPKELVEMFGFDIEKEDFWQIGLEEIKSILEEFKELANAR